MFARVEWEGERSDPVIVFVPRNEGEELTLSLLADHGNVQLRFVLPTSEELVKRWLVEETEESD